MYSTSIHPYIMQHLVSKGITLSQPMIRELIDANESGWEEEQVLIVIVQNDLMQI